MNTALPPAAHGDEPAATAAAGPGRLLRTARESAGIGLRDVAAQMHLDERTISALENDAFGQLPAPTFVRGYLRGYARLLGVPLGPVMEAYDREGFRPPDLVADIAEKPQANSSDFPVRVTTYVVVVVLAALVVAWWHNQGFDEPVAIAPAPMATPETSSAARTQDGGAGARPTQSELPAGEVARSVEIPPVPASRPAPPFDSPVARSAPPPAPPGAARPDAAAPATDSGTSVAGSERVSPGSGTTPAVEQRVESVLTEAERVLARTRNEIDAAARAPLPRPGRGNTDTAGPDAAQQPPSGGGGDASARSATASAPSADPAPAPTSGMARLRVRFPDEAWVEVYDRNEQRLFYNLVTPGRVLDLQGAPPIRVLLGRTRGVEVEYNGEPVDLAPHTERGVARLTLGE